MFNKVILHGNLTRDPELRYTPTGTAVAKFGLAINRKWKDANTGEQKEEVTFVDIDCFGKTAENIGQWFKKGNQMLLEGRLKLDQWEDKQTNQRRSKLGVVLETFSFVGANNNEGGGREERSEPRQPRPAGQRAFAPTGSELPAEEDDVPF
jgi:single-strand DNA-binding protein